MIWVGGRIIPDGSLSIPAEDRTFEHGLGLFETARTWSGRPVLLDAHRARMLRSSQELGMPIDPGAFPDVGAVADLLRAEGHDTDRILRITASGGTPQGPGPVVWMKTLPLPPPPPRNGFVLSPASWTVVARDPTAQHKMLNYWPRRVAYEQARAGGCDEILTMTPGGFFWEGSRTNLFAIVGGCLHTPSLIGPIVPGVMRQFVLDLARDLSWEVREIQGIGGRELTSADEVFLTNAVRGIIPVGRRAGRIWPAPCPRTLQLQICLAERLAAIEGSS